jgi:PAS domain S-box-containing protein
LLRRIGILCGLIVALTAIVVQIGWVIHSTALVQIKPEFSSMKFNSALCFLLCAINLIFFNSRYRILKSIGLLASLLALITASQYYTNTSNGIDTLFNTPFAQLNAQYIGRISLTSCCIFIQLGILLFLGANFPQNRWLRLFIIICTSAILSLAIIPLLAYMAGIQSAYVWNIFTGMAVHTAFCFIFLGMGLICQLWSRSSGPPYFLLIPVILCLLTSSFATSWAIHTYENLKYNESIQEDAYYRTQAGPRIQAFDAHFLHRESSYIAYFVLFFGLLTSALLSLTLYYHLKSRQSAKALANSEERLHLAITGTTDGLFDWDVPSGDFYFSPRFEEVLGYATHSLHPTYATFLELIHPQDLEKFKHTAATHFDDRSPINFELRLKTRIGEYIWFTFRGTPICDSAGQRKRMTGFINDISVRNEIDKMKNDFISTVSHELRTPMTSIGGSLSLILGGKVGACEGKVKELLLIADRNCERLLRLINDILDIEKIAAGDIDFKLTNTDLAIIVKEVVSHNVMFAEKFNIKLTFLPLANLIVRVDVDRLMQVLTNLISNAVKFSKPGTEVIITMQKEANKARVSVIDHGQGIPEDFKKNIFQKFSQADSSSTKDNKGSGLGLSISKAIMEKLGGRLSFTSVISQGTTFYLELPLVN